MEDGASLRRLDGATLIETLTRLLAFSANKTRTRRRVGVLGVAVVAACAATRSSSAAAAFISGARAVVDTTRPPGSRIVSLTLDSGTPLDDRMQYTIVINDFMATGGDDLAFPDSTAVMRELRSMDLDATIAYLKTLPSPVRAPRANRWTFKT